MTARPLLTSGDVAQVLGVSTGFIRGEVKEGRLRAAVAIERPSARTLYRFDPIDVRAYCERYSKSALERLPSDWFHVKEQRTERTEETDA